jgi:hypothetical protein
MLKADGLEDAIIGSCYDKATGTFRIVYKLDRCVELLAERDGIRKDVALEWLQHNTLGPYVGNDGPIFVENWKHDATNNR